MEQDRHPVVKLVFFLCILPDFLAPFFHFIGLNIAEVSLRNI